MVVAGISASLRSPRTARPTTWYAKKCRFLQWGRNYTWAGTADTTRHRNPSIDPHGRGGIPGARPVRRPSPFGDLARWPTCSGAAAWKTADMVKVSVRPGGAARLGYHLRLSWTYRRRRAKRIGRSHIDEFHPRRRSRRIPLRRHSRPDRSAGLIGRSRGWSTIGSFRGRAPGERDTGRVKWSEIRRGRPRSEAIKLSSVPHCGGARISVGVRGRPPSRGRSFPSSPRGRKSSSRQRLF